jgi:hypothetical protein
MDLSRRAAILQTLADSIARRGLLTPARIILDVVEPLGFLASQAALFARPFAPLGSWQEYLTALDDQEGWKILHDIVDR